MDRIKEIIWTLLIISTTNAFCHSNIKNRSESDILLPKLNQENPLYWNEPKLDPSSGLTFIGLSLINSNDGVSGYGNFAQLFILDPDILPAIITQVSLKIYALEIYNFTVKISLYMDNDGFPGTQIISKSAYIEQKDGRVLWNLVEFNENERMISWERAIWVGASWDESNIDHVVVLLSAWRYILYNETNARRTDCVFYRNGMWLRMSEYLDSDVYNYVTPYTYGGLIMTVVANKTSITEVGVHPDWLCTPLKWNDGVTCDCKCGAVDPDCYNTSLPTVGCPTSGNFLCIRGRCIQTTTECISVGAKFGQFDGCDCGINGCNIFDPDCKYLEQKVNGCPGDYICDATSNECKIFQWNCPYEKYKDGKACDCNCKNYDPDCLNITLPVENCYEEIDAKCVEAQCVPDKWTCPLSYYNANDGCNCDCGLFDQDCYNLQGKLYGCPDSNYTCSYEGKCVISNICGNNRTEQGEECDGMDGCGIDCHCKSGYYPTGIFPFIHCDRICGDNIAVYPEECDGGYGCNETCHCTINVGAYSPPRFSCGPVCNNGIRDDGEECDSGIGCNDDCMCSQDYEVVSEGIDCKSKSESNTKLIGGLIGGIGGGFVIIMIIASGAFIFIIRYKRSQNKYLEYKLSRGMQMDSCEEFNNDESEFVLFNDFPLEISKNVIDFGYSTSPAQIDKEITDIFTISNRSDICYSIKFYRMPNHRLNINFNPPEVCLKSGEEVSVEVIVKILCTTIINDKFIIAICQDKEWDAAEYYTYVNMKLESCLSNKIDPDEIILYEPKIGEGAFADVFRGRWRQQIVAVKVLKNQGFGIDCIDEDFKDEVEIMSKLKSPYIVNFIGSSFVPSRLAILTEFLELGNLRHCMEKHKFNQKLKFKCIKDISEGMAFLHSCGILHRDLKADNILMASLDENSVCCKIADFGTTRETNRSHEATQYYTKGIGTPIYMAPEILNVEPYSQSADVYSFSIVVWSIYTEKEPYSDPEFSAPYKVTSFVIDGKRMNIPYTVPQNIRKIISDCWDQDPHKRPSKYNYVVYILIFFFKKKRFL